MEQPKKENKKEGMSWLEKLQLSLDAAGMVPGYGEFADLANAAIYGAQGDWKNAGISAAAMIPVIGSTGTAARIAYKGAKVAGDALPVVSRVKTAQRLGKKGVDYAMPPSVQRKWVKKSKTKPVQSTDTPDPSKVKKAINAVNPKNWSTTTKVGVGLGAGYGIYEGGKNLSEKGFIGPSNENKEIPNTELIFNKETGQHEYTPAPDKEMGMGGVVQHDGGVQKPITERMSEYIGKSHDQGGIKLQDGGVESQNIEVEGGEAEYSDMPMSDGNTSDYIFSDKLKYGSGTFADAAKGMAENGGSEKQIMTLAKMQEATAKNKGEKGRNPNIIMEDGGYKNLGNAGVAGMQGGLEGGYYGSQDANMVGEEAERKDFYERNKAILNDLGINSYKDYNPKQHAEMFQNKVNQHFKDKYENDEDLRAKLEGEGIKDAAAYAKSAGFGDTGAKAMDGKHGEYTNSITTYEEPPAEPPVVNEDKPKDTDEIVEEAEIEESGEQEEYKPPSNVIGNIANMGAVAMALGDTPDTMPKSRQVTPGIVVAERQGNVNLDRVDNNDLLARNANDSQAVSKSIDHSGGGSSNIVNKMLLFSKKAEQDRQIKGDTNRTNASISNQEGTINATINRGNADRATSASSQNASNILDANKTNIANENYVNEFNAAAKAATFDRKLNAVETFAGNLNQNYRDKLSYASQERIAKATSGNSGVYDRELMQSLLNKLNTTT